MNDENLCTDKREEKIYFWWLSKWSERTSSEAAKSFKFPYHWILLRFIYVNKIKKKTTKKNYSTTQRESTFNVWMSRVADTQKIRRKMRGTMWSEFNWITWRNSSSPPMIYRFPIKLWTQLWKNSCFWYAARVRGWGCFMFCNAANCSTQKTSDYNNYRGHLVLGMPTSFRDFFLQDYVSR